MSLSVSIGIIAYNEGKNIQKLLQSLEQQILQTVIIKEIIVVSSGSTDKTNEIVRKFASKNKKIKLLVQKKRLGKSSAVNLFMAKSGSKIVILMAADIILAPQTIENLVKPLRNSRVGIVGCHPIPVNDPQSFMGYAAKTLWELHHQISLTKPKMGEVIAFRKIFTKIPVLSAVDEANIEPLIRGQGFKAIYAQGAIIRNKGPETIREFIAVRRRVYAGHLAAKHEYSYEVSTLSGFKIFPYIFKNFSLSWKFFIWTPLIICLEIYSRFLGFLDYKYKLKKHTVWEITPSTKQLSAD